MVFQNYLRRERSAGTRCAQSYQSIKHVLRRLDDIALEVLSAFSADALLRTGPELTPVRELAWEAEAIDASWIKESVRYRDADENVRDDDLQRYDELKFAFALEGLEVPSALCRVDNLFLNPGSAGHRPGSGAE
ncbi:hypothetical protein [Actinacidiphila oryziradicis]|uniref:Uncharacterized protein n=1 Tax=Actinacidiphila oryziradicis TaxID=2571141 RepID=A0A4U0RVA1_9ACTN|nr:hypothetical protein [Actinacidiphila oryziradicis]TKA00184.1 hypothetical protein FCI23_43385 [Actinacidiphila oryziradicis]